MRWNRVFSIFFALMAVSFAGIAISYFAKIGEMAPPEVSKKTNPEIAIPKENSKENLKTEFQSSDFGMTPLGFFYGFDGEMTPLKKNGFLERNYAMEFPEMTPDANSRVRFLFDTYAMRGSSGDGLITYSPLLLTFHQTFDFGEKSAFRPVATAGFGFLRQARFDGAKGEVENELRTMFRFGLGAEWSPSENVIFRAGYDFSHLPIRSSLNPDISANEHAFSVGVEIKF